MMRALVAVLLALVLIAAKPGGPDVTLSGDTVSGTGFLSSSDGQQVILWVQTAECGQGSACGFYVNPDVADDGTFSIAVPDGTLLVRAFQWNEKKGRWLLVDEAAI